MTGEPKDFPASGGEGDGPDSERELRLDRILTDYLKAADAGQAPTPQDLFRAHPDLAPELAELLEADRQFGRLLAAQPDRSATPPGPSLRGGMRFGEYELSHEIARGGMGIVYEALQPRLGRKIALKTISAFTSAREDVVERFRREAAAAARLVHPNIVPIHDVGEHDGCHYFTMKLLSGGNLTQRIDRYARDPRATALLLATLAQAAEHAHRSGILHRDLKPANVVFDELDTPYITDFGLAKALEGEGDALTQTGALLGTPAYMAPELTAKDRPRLSPAVDVYGLGTILYELLTGGPPFRGISTLETLRALVEDQPQPPRLKNPGVPRDLETICLKCLEKDPRRRYASAAALADDLRFFLAGAPVRARPTPPLERAARWIKRNRTLSAVVLLLLVLASASTLAALLLARSERRALESLRESHHARAQMGRFSARAGRRFQSLEALAAAAAIRPGLDLRNEAAGCLALVDLHRVRTLGGHTPGRETAGAVDDAFRRYAYASPTGDIAVRSLDADEKVLITLRAGSPVKGLRFSADGRFLGASLVRIFKAWDLEHPTVPPVTVRRMRFRRGCDFVPGASRAAVGLPTGHLRLVALAPGAEADESIPAPGVSSVTCVAFGPAEAGLAVAGVDILQRPVIAILDAEEHSVRTKLYPGHAPADLAWHPDGIRLAVAGSNQVSIWDTLHARRVSLLSGHQSEVVGLSFARSGRFLASTSWDNVLRLWDSDSGLHLVSATGNLATHFGPDDSVLASISNAGPVELWQVANGAECRILRDRHSGEKPLRSVDFAAGGRLLAVAGRDGVGLWDVERGEQVKFLPMAGAVASALHDGSTAAILTLRSGEVASFPVHESSSRPGSFAVGPAAPFGAQDALIAAGGPAAISLTRDGKLLAAILSFQAGTGSVLTREGEKIMDLTGLPGFAQVAISPDGRWAAGGARHGAEVARVWDIPARAVARDLPVGGNSLVTFSPNGAWLVTGSGQEYRLWELGSWKCLWTLARDNPGQSPGPAAFSPGEDLLAVVQDLTAIRLVDPATGRELGTLSAPEPALVRSLAFSPSGRWLAVAVENGPNVQLWDLQLLRRGLRAVGLDW